MVAMGIYHRDYMRDQPGGRRGGSHGGPKDWSLITWLIVINCAAFVGQHVIFAPSDAPIGWQPGGAISWDALSEGKIWLLFTSMLVHGSLFHLAVNCVGIFFVGRLLITMVSSKQFLTIYIGAGLLGGLLFSAFYGMIGQGNESAVGASGCLYGLICALAALIPDKVISVMLFFILPISAKMKHIAGGLVLIGVVMTAFNLLAPEPSAAEGPETAHLGHLGGALFGWLYITFLMPRSKRKYNEQSRRQRWGERFGAKEVVDADYVDRRADRKREKKRKASERKRAVSSEVDAILDKINEKGFQSLTPKERKILDASSDKLG